MGSSNFIQYNDIIHQYMPARGQGDSIASQVVTAINRLVYKWFNDGDVYDNQYALEGWANDLSSEANWLADHGKNGTYAILEQISDCRDEEDYEDILLELCEHNLKDKAWLADAAQRPAIGSIYDADGPFKFVDRYDDEDDEYPYPEAYDDDDEDYDEEDYE